MAGKRQRKRSRDVEKEDEKAEKCEQDKAEDDIQHSEVCDDQEGPRAKKRKLSIEPSEARVTDNKIKDRKESTERDDVIDREGNETEDTTVKFEDNNATASEILAELNYIKTTKLDLKTIEKNIENKNTDSAAEECNEEKDNNANEKSYNEKEIEISTRKENTDSNAEEKVLEKDSDAIKKSYKEKGGEIEKSNKKKSANNDAEEEAVEIDSDSTEESYKEKEEKLEISIKRGHTNSDAGENDSGATNKSFKVKECEIQKSFKKRKIDSGAAGEDDSDTIKKSYKEKLQEVEKWIKKEKIDKDTEKEFGKYYSDATKESYIKKQSKTSNSEDILEKLKNRPINLSSTTFTPKIVEVDEESEEDSDTSESSSEEEIQTDKQKKNLKFPSWPNIRVPIKHGPEFVSQVRVLTQCFCPRDQFATSTWNRRDAEEKVFSQNYKRWDDFLLPRFLRTTIPNNMAKVCVIGEEDFPTIDKAGLYWMERDESIRVDMIRSQGNRKYESKYFTQSIMKNLDEESDIPSVLR